MIKYPVVLKWDREASINDLLCLGQLSASMPTGDFDLDQLDEWLPFRKEIKALAEDLERWDESQPEWDHAVEMSERAIDKLLAHHAKPPEHLSGAFIGDPYAHFRQSLLKIKEGIKKGDFKIEEKSEEEKKKKNPEDAAAKAKRKEDLEAQKEALAENE